MQHVVQFSGGLASLITAKRVIDKHGRDDVTLLFADTKTEDCDLYRFVRDCEQYLGVSVTTIEDGRDIWQVFDDTSFIGNSRIDACSRVLKREPLERWREANCSPDNSVFYIGFDWTEGHRAKRLLEYVKPWKYEFPLFEKPLYTKTGMIAWAESEGLKIPRLYKMGFDHNNCGGACVKAGHAQWRHLLKTMPDRYAYHETKEMEWRAKHGDRAILRSRTGGESRPLTLKEFREEIQSNPTATLFDEEWGGCGCATDYGDDDSSTGE